MVLLHYARGFSKSRCSRFKKSGEFDRLRRELLSSFRTSVSANPILHCVYVFMTLQEGMVTLVARVEEIAKNKMTSEHQLQHMPEALAVRELMQELERWSVPRRAILPQRTNIFADRYPLVERAIADVPALTEASFSTSLRQQIAAILYDKDGSKLSMSFNVDSGGLYLYLHQSGSCYTADNGTEIQNGESAQQSPDASRTGNKVTSDPDTSTAPAALVPSPGASSEAVVADPAKLALAGHSPVSSGVARVPSPEPDSPGSAMLESPPTDAEQHLPEPEAMSLSS